MNPGLKQWDRDLIAYLFSPRDTELILNIPLSYMCIEDEWYWMEEEKGMHTVKSGYRTQHLLVDEQRSQLWTMVWNLMIPPKSRNFMWRMLCGILPTTNKLRSRMVQVLTLCPICANKRETIHHRIFHCILARECWLLTPFPIIGRAETIFSWASRIFSTFSLENAELVAMICWAIWTN